MVRKPRSVPKSQPIVIHALDMGEQMYGDCLLVLGGGVRVLIDGGHSSDFDGQPGYRSIPEQLAGILGPPPFAIDLLVVTHCHSDHIGCLPQMVARGLIKPAWALVADEKLGFGRATDDPEEPDAVLPLPARRVLAALREEDRTGLDAPDLADFLRDVATLESRYKTMLVQLAASGTRVVRYGRDDPSDLVSAFGMLGLRILGPTTDHLLVCAEAIAKADKAIKDELQARFRTDTMADAVAVYRAMSRAPWDAVVLLDRPGKGAAINDQSIVLSIGAGDQKALLPGDMQLAKPEVTGLRDMMSQLRQDIAQAGPYRFFKLPHHTSYNGIDDSVLENAGGPGFVLHTGGRNDGGHPDKAALALLASRSASTQFARTDRHGMIRYDMAGSFTLSQGALNDFSPNATRDVEREAGKSGPGQPPQEAERGGGEPANLEPQEPEFLEFVYVKVPNRPMTFTIGGVPITIGGPAKRPFEEGLSSQGKPDTGVGTRLAGGRALPDLLFVTNSTRLEANVGRQEARVALRLIEAAEHRLLDVAGLGGVAEAVRQAAGGHPGVVLVGGYDVLPAQRVDVLDPALRQEVGARVQDDPDGFIVWSDDIYGDTDGDMLAEIPVTRIPDGRSSGLLLTVLGGLQPAQRGRFGIINRERPFASDIWSIVEGDEPSLLSGPALAATLEAASLSKRHLYFMLHGDHADGSRFWGEMNGAVEAINVSKLPVQGPDIVFAGCCWGALTVDQLAMRRDGSLGVRTPGQSMALSLLRSGARAFIGCTGAHYSPGEGEDSFGAPMHKAFWLRVKTGDQPAQALFNARKAYLAALPHGLTQPYHVAIERKIYRQFTCLGLAW